MLLIGVLQLVELLTQIKIIPVIGITYFGIFLSNHIYSGSSKNGQHMLLRSIYHIYDFFTKDRSFSKQKVLYSKGQ